MYREGSARGLNELQGGLGMLLTARFTLHLVANVPVSVTVHRLFEIKMLRNEVRYQNVPHINELIHCNIKYLEKILGHGLNQVMQYSYHPMKFANK